MTKFKFTPGSATKKGTPIHTVRVITKDHSMYPFVFDEYGNKRSHEEIKRLITEAAEKKGLVLDEQK